MRRALSSVVVVALSVLASGPGVIAMEMGDLTLPEVEVTSSWLRVESSEVAPGDRIEISSESELDLTMQSRMPWQQTDAGSWQLVTDRTAASSLTWLDLGLLPPDGAVTVAVIRRASDGSREIRLEREIRREPAGGSLVVGATYRVEQWRGVALTIDDPPSELGVDASGRTEVALDDSRAAGLIGRASKVEPFVRAVSTAVGSVTGSTTINQAFSDAICGVDPWLGRSIQIATAPVGAEVLNLDLEYTIYHSVDISRFKSGLWHNIGTGWDDQVVLYEGDLAGANWTTGMPSGLSQYSGDPVNADYILGSCNIFGVEEAYLDEWSITIYFTEPGPTIDLVADSVTVASGSVTSGSSLGFGLAGHVGGSGTVGGDVVVGIYLASNPGLTSNMVWLANRTYPSADDPGDGFSENVGSYSVTIPSSVAAGSYYIGIVVDDGNQIDETNESNNVRSVALTVNAPAQPNLRMVSCSLSSSTVAPGDQVTLSWRGENAGGGAAGTFEREAFLSSDASYQFGSDTSLDRTEEAGGWSGGYNTGSRSVNVTVPAGAADGSYRLGMALDIRDDVTESNESDNVCMANLTVSSAPAGTTRWLIPAAASAPGVGGSNWKTQVSVVNPTGATRQASLYFVAKGAAWPGVLLAGPYNLAPNQSVYLDDPLLALSPVTGLVYVQLDAPGPVVTSRTFNLADDGSTFGQGIAAQPLDGVAAPTELILPMVHSAPNRFRTNLGLIQADSGSYRVEVSIFTSGGSLLATTTYNRTAAYDQITNVFDNMGLGSTAIEGAWIKVRLVSGSPTYWTCYASVVDFDSNDPTYIPPEISSN